MLLSCICIFLDRCLSLCPVSPCPFSFGHCAVSPCTFSFGQFAVSPSSIYGFWLSLCYLQTLLTEIRKDDVVHQDNDNIFWYDVLQTLWVQTNGKNNIHLWPITS